MGAQVLGLIQLGLPLRLLALDQVFLVRGRQGFVVTFTTLEDERDRYEATFQEMARSLRFD